VRPPEEIAVECDNCGHPHRWIPDSVQRELDELVADRDALLAVARAAHTAWYNDARYSVQVEEAIAALPEHLRQQVEQT
jgi:hypothetical protein